MHKTKNDSARVDDPVAPSRQEPRRRRTRAALLLAGADLLARRPIDAISVNDIVEAAGVAKGSFFNHFPDKDAFASAIAGEIRAEIEAQVTLANLEVEDPAMRIARAIAGYVQFARLDPARATVLLRSEASTVLADHPLNRGVTADLLAGLKLGRFRSRAGDAGVPFLCGVCHMTLASVLATPTTRDAARALADDMLVLALTGLGIDESEAQRVASTATTAILIDTLTD